MPETWATKIAATLKIQRAACQIEAVAGGNDERDDLPRNADGFHRLHGAGQRGLGAGGAEGNRHRLGHSFEEAPQRNAEQQRNRQQNAEDENDQRGIQREQQLQQAAQNAESGVSHSVGHGRADPERRHVHHDVGELEHHLAQALAERQHGPALLLR